MRRFITVAPILFCLACGTQGEGASPPRATTTSPAEPAANAPEARGTPSPPEHDESVEPAEPAALDAEPFLGRWTQTDDPTGTIEVAPIYVGSFIELGADGSYAFALGGGGSMGPMRGTWEAITREGDVLRYRAVFSGGRTTAPQTLTLRRGGGAVVGIVAGNEETGSRYLVRDPP